MSKNYGEASWNSNFSHIYVEKAARKYKRTEELLAKFPNAELVEIERYQDVFHPNGQEFSYQKQSQKLILAVKYDSFLYPGANVCERFHEHHFYYTSSVLNCIYDCEYCYLQGVYSSANIVIFVNLEDFFEEVERELHKKQNLYVCISYDTDLLAMEGLTSFVRDWYAFASKHPSLKIELRTKSAKGMYFSNPKGNPNFILAWTLSNMEVAKNMEKKTPSLEQRLEAICKWQEQGFWVRLCFDPLLEMENFERIQRQLLELCFSRVNKERILDVSVGTFRVSKEYLKKMRKQNRNAKSLAYPFVCEEGVYGYPKEIRRKMMGIMKRELLRYLPVEKIYLGGEE